ncbi:MAG TPA: DUF3006 domain-containing protein [Firmicutes bacterium]|nr:DUF3006 domain-containing protein [Bacillota bacterium]
MKELTGSIDRIEGELAVIILDKGGELIIPKDSLPTGNHEGSVVKIKISLDPEEEKKRLEEVKNLQERLVKRTQEKKQ